MKLDKAKQVYENFVGYEGIAERININGHAGLAVTYYLLNEKTKSREELEQLNSLDMVAPYLRRKIRSLKNSRFGQEYRPRRGVRTQ